MNPNFSRQRDTTNMLCYSVGLWQYTFLSSSNVSCWLQSDKVGTGGIVMGWNESIFHRNLCKDDILQAQGRTPFRPDTHDMGNGPYLRNKECVWSLHCRPFAEFVSWQRGLRFTPLDHRCRMSKPGQPCEQSQESERLECKPASPSQSGETGEVKSAYSIWAFCDCYAQICENMSAILFKLCQARETIGRCQSVCNRYARL